MSSGGGGGAGAGGRSGAAGLLRERRCVGRLLRGALKLLRNLLLFAASASDATRLRHHLAGPCCVQRTSCPPPLTSQPTTARAATHSRSQL